MRELDEACARALKLEVLVDGRPMYMIPDHDRAWLLSPEFSSDRAWSFLLEDEIERRGLVDPYMIALLGEGGSYLLSLSVAWELLRATPEQRARAFLKAVSDA